MPFDMDLLGDQIAPVSPKPLRITQAVLPLSKQKGETLRQKRHRLRRQAGLLMENERVRRCGRCRHSQNVDIHRTKHGAHFVGLETCGSVWHCPVCAAKVSETRRDEVAKVIEGIEPIGGSTYMLTLTMRHNKHDKLSFLREQIVNGWRSVANRRAYRAIKDEFGVLGTIRAIEVTHGANGWHPHLHILFVFEGPLLERDETNVKNRLSAIWVDVLEKNGGGYVSLDALDFRPATASDYVTKWGADRELVKGQEKLGTGSRTPWQLLDAAKEDLTAGALFKEYAETFKGTRQLTWSKGLKAMFGIGDITDEDISLEATETDEELPLDDGLKEGRVLTLDRGTMDAVVRLNKTAEILDAAHAGGTRGVKQFLANHGLGTYHDDSFMWKQPPKGGRPAHPKYYLKYDREEMTPNARN